MYEFGVDDVFYNRVKTYPEADFIIYDNKLYYQNKGTVVGENVANVPNVPTGYINLYELNVDRASDQLIYPFIVKGGSLTSFNTTTTSKYNSDFLYGDQITGSYPLSASITSDYHQASSTRPKIVALRNSLNAKQILNYDYAYSSSLGDKSTQELRLISIPSIFYGSSIKKGSMSLKFYISGTQVAELTDNKRNGQLRQSLSGSGAQSGSVGGIVMYDEGFIILTGSWSLDAYHTENYTGAGAAAPRWIDFGAMNSLIPSSSFQLTFSGTNYVPTILMMAHAPKGELNHSNNPTYPQYTTRPLVTGTLSQYAYEESPYTPIANVGSSSFSGSTKAFDKVTFINHIGIYDENHNLIAITKLANPVRKRENDDYTFKLKLDI